MSRSLQSSGAQLSSSGTNLDDIAIEMENLGGGDEKDATLRSIASSIPSTSGKDTSGELGGLLT